MRKLLRDAAAWLCYPVARLRDPGVRILMYHRVNPFHAWDRLSVHPERFREQMAHLKTAGYRTVTLAGYCAQASANAARTLVITFDDGYRDNFEFALPVLREFGFTAVFFVVTGHAGRETFSRRYEGAGGDNRLMSWEEIAGLQHAGMEVGSHTMNHVKLAQADETQTMLELESSLRMLQERGLACGSLCYPAGSYRQRTAELARQAGYACAVTTRPGGNFPGGDLFQLRRTEVSGIDTLRDFKAKLAGAYDAQHALTHWWNQRG